MAASYVVIDTNVWVRQFLTPGGAADAAITKAFERYTPVFDRDTFEELHTRLESPKLAKHSTREQREAFLEIIIDNSVFIERIYEVKRSRDPDDNKFIGVAMTIGAANIISGDEHLQEIKHYQGIQIWSPEQFIARERTLEREAREQTARDPFTDALNAPPTPDEKAWLEARRKRQLENDKDNGRDI